MATEPVRIQPTFKFGDDFELNLRAYELRRAGQMVKLEPTPFELLVFLVEQRGNLVGRQQIVERIWGKGVFLDTDNSINGAIRKIRQVLDDDPENPRFIQTVTGKGYRFIAPAVESEETRSLHILELPPQQPAGDVPVTVSRTNFKHVVVLSLFIVIIAGLALWIVPALSRSKGVAALPIRSIAVLPLDNLSGDPAQDYFADAMTDELITDLAKVGALRVTSRTTVTLYKHTRKSLPQIAHELNVDGIVEGSVVRSGQRVRITAQLIRASADQHVWAETYERDLGDALRLQSDVAEAITKQVRAQLTPELKEQFSGTRPVDPRAYDAYLKGRYYIYNQSFTDPVSLNQAKVNFEEAIRRDPNFSPAYSGLAETYICLVLFGRGQITAADGFRSARNDVQRALELDPNNGEAYNALGELNWYADLDWNAAERSFNKAIALAPSYSCAHEDRAMLMALMGHRAEALTELEKVKQIDPGPDSVGVESAVYLQLRDWEHLRERSRVRLASDPNNSEVHADLGIAYEGTGDLPEAIAEYQKAIELSNGDPGAVASLAHAYAVIGNREEAEKLLRNIEEQAKSGKASPYLAATIYAGLGQKEKAIELIEKAYREKSFDVAWALKFDLRTDNLRADPRFQNLLQRVSE
jgi:TolB-like protein/DNA-binding winged helix-turn-helix (wHTH) protein/Flp pilus assembly protein TadD